jgi:hypothetical protein
VRKRAVIGNSSQLKASFAILVPSRLFPLLGSELYPLCGQNEEITDYSISVVHRLDAALNEVPAEEEGDTARRRIASAAQAR